MSSNGKDWEMMLKLQENYEKSGLTFMEFFKPKASLFSKQVYSQVNPKVNPQINIENEKFPLDSENCPRPEIIATHYNEVKQCWYGHYKTLNTIENEKQNPPIDQRFGTIHGYDPQL